MIHAIKQRCKHLLSHYNYALISLLALFCVQLIWLDKIPLIAMDEPWAGNTAYNMSKGLGFINTNKGMWGGDHLFLMPAVTWPWIKVFGLSLFSIRFASFFCGLMTLVGWVNICRHFQVNAFITTLVGSLFLFSNVFFVIFHWGRPESLVCTLLVWAIVFLLWTEKKPLYAIATSFCLSLGCLAHPHLLAVCIVYALFIGIVCVKKKTLIPAVYSALGVGWTCVILVIFIQQHFSEFGTFFSDLAHLSSGRSYQETGRFGHFVVTNITQFFTTYTMGWKRAFIFSFECLILIVGATQKTHKPIRYFSLAGILSLIIAFIGFFFRRRYFGIILIFSYIVLALGLTHYYKKPKKTPFYLLLFLTGIYLMNNIAGDAYLLIKNRHAPKFSSIESYLKTQVPANARVLSHLEFWTGLSETTWLHSVDQLRPGDYIVLSDHFKKAISPTTGQIDDIHNVKQGENYKYNTWYEQASLYGILRSQKQTHGYGDIQIWQIKVDVLSP